MSTSDYLNREQSQIKHFALGKYLQVAARIVGSFRNLAYIDCCAGPWGSQNQDRSDTSFGVALRELRHAREFLISRGKNPKVRALLIEKDIEAFANLKAFADEASSAGITVRAENWDFTEHLQDIVAFATSDLAFPFAFIDPKGWKLAQVNLIRPLLQLNPGEVLINLMSSFVTRFVNDANQDFTDLLGADFAEVRELSGADQEDEVVRRYCDAVRLVGKFPYVCALPIMKADQDAFHFHLIYATRHLKGVEKFKEVERNAVKETHAVRAEKQRKNREERFGSGDLFTPEVLYQESRYQRLERKNRTLAETAVLNLIRSRKHVLYDDCWAEAMQFATAYEDDLRGWLAAWESLGSIRIVGRRFPAEVLKIRSQHKVVSEKPEQSAL